MNEDGLIDQMLRIFSSLAASGQRIPVEIIQGLSRILESRIGEIGATPAPQIPSGADLLWILSGGNRDSFINYLSTIPDPALNALARNPQELQRTIQQLSRQVTMPHGEVQQGIPKADLQSSNVYGFQYDPRSQTMFVKFNGKDSVGSGPIYEYEGVPPQIFKIVKAGAVPCKTTGSNKWGKWWVSKSPSLGSSVSALLVKGAYPYQKVA